MNRKRQLILVLAFLMIAFTCAVFFARRNPPLSLEAKRAVAAVKQEAIRRGWKRFKIDAPRYTDGDWVTTVRALPYVPGEHAYVRVRDGELIEWNPGL